MGVVRCRGGIWAALPLAALLAAAPASADTAIYYSAREGTYGWCAGFAYARAHSCAQRYCVEAGGSACTAIAECAGGYGAVALADDPATGVAAVCGLGDLTSVRFWALSHCAVASNTLCWTYASFDGRGSQASGESNEAFDLTWYAQAMLQVRGYEPGVADGVPGARTRQEIARFQGDVGLPADGRLSREVFDRLLDAVGGAGHLAAILDRDVVQKKQQQDLGYADAAVPAPKRTISEELAALPDLERRVRVATMLRTSGSACSIPATGAMNPFGDGEMWMVACAEGSYTLILSPDGTRTIIKGGGQ